MPTTITQNNNEVEITLDKPIITVTDNNKGTSVNVTQTNTSVVSIATPGPKGDVPTGDVLFGHVTASGNISASGIIIGGEFTSSKGILITSSLTNLGSKNAFLVRFNDSNGQPEKFSVSSSGVVRFGSLDTLPTPITGGIVYSASNFYFGI